MANHVSSRLEFIRLNPEARKTLAMMLKWNEMGRENGRLENFHEIMDHSPEDPDYNWYHDHIGPKWCYFEDYDLDQIVCTSAWGWPDKGFAWLINQLRKDDPFLLARATYEDEAPNFYGVAGWGPKGYEDYYIDIREGINFMRAEHRSFDMIYEHLPKTEDEEWSEGFQENMWEAINTHQDILWDNDCKDDVELDSDKLYDQDGYPKHNENPWWSE